MENTDFKDAYQKVLESGMFWEFHPELTGDYSKDKLEWETIYQNLLNIRNMNAPGYDKDFYEFEKLQRFKVEPKLNLNLGESIRREPKANLRPDIGAIIERNFQPKPILFMKIPNGWVYEQSDMDALEKQVNDAGWFFLYFQTNVSDVMIEAFTLKDSQKIELEKLKEQIINEIKGK
jgi:hypothetical protein